MTKSKYTISGITDTNSHDLPDTNGDDGAVEKPINATTYNDRFGVFITNHADQTLTASLERAPLSDENMAREATDIGGISIASGETDILSADDTVPYGFFRVIVSYNSIPTTADPSVTVEFQGE